MEPNGPTKSLAGDPGEAGEQRAENNAALDRGGDPRDPMLVALDLTRPTYTSIGFNRWLVSLVALAAFLVGLSIGVLSTLYRAQNVQVAFSEPLQDAGDVCANSTIHQSNTMIVNGPAFIQMAATIYDEETGTAYYPLSESYTLVAPEDKSPRVIRDPFTWRSPSLPPARYIRVLAAAIYRNVPPVTTVTSFSIVECPTDKKPIPTTTPVAIQTATPSP